MNFFKSILSDDPEPLEPSDPQEGEGDQQQRSERQHVEEDEEASSSPSSPFSAFPGGGGGGKTWASFGGLIKTITTRSESVIQTYRRDLEEFSSGLKKETEVFKEVASRAVLDLPGSLEVGASVAQESLETVGQAIDNLGGSVWRGTTEIISQGKEALSAAEAESSSSDVYWSDANSQIAGNSGRRHSRFEALVLAVQNDGNTFVEEPEDQDDFDRWRLGFKLEEKEEEMETLLYDNGTLEGFFEKFVPDVVDKETFWSRYFYRIYRLKQAEVARAELVKRVILHEHEEDLSWEVDDDDNAEEETREIKKEKQQGEVKAIAESSQAKPREEATKEAAEISVPIEEKNSTKVSQVEDAQEGEKVKSNQDEARVHSEERSEPKDGDFTVVSSQPSMQEEDEDFGWDEIEDIGEHDDKKSGGSSGSSKQVDLRKKLVATEDDEDLSWDIEDDED